ncbi:MAG: GMC family oxidoreductase [Henriciella sp.]|nr:GMC family oxidoreductase [Henriciella sp.]
MVFVARSELDLSRYDAIVAGSGPAGGSVAEGLSRGNRKVLVIETGGSEYRAEAQENYSAVKGGGHYVGSHWSSHWIRMLGGTSNIWGGWCAPFSERNFDRWPISRSDLEPYYLSAAQALYRPPDFLTYRKSVLDQFEYRAISDEDPLRYSDPVKFATFPNDPNVHVLLEHSVGALTASQDGSRVEAFELYGVSEGNRELIELREEQALVLAGGAMGNAQILLASNDGTRASIGDEHGQVGRYLQEHPHMGVGKIICRANALIPSMDEGFGGIRHALFPSDSLYHEAGELDVCLVLSEASIDSTDQTERYLSEEFGPGARAYRVSVMAGRAENHGSRAEGFDPCGWPLLFAQCVVDSDSLEAVDFVMRSLGSSLLDSNVGRLRFDVERVYSDIGGGGHTIGTTRMGTDATSSVVDSDCRVHGYRNLFIAGSSVFATGSCVNPTLTIVALAQRLADYLAKGI